jgi:V/A-type H+-transporting ATPase subunit D
MADLVGRVPPGRAGRLWLRRRLSTARHGVTLLDRKLRILRTEQERSHLRAERTEADWYARCRDAERWLAPSAALGGQREIRLASTTPTAEVEVVWDNTMNVSYPAEARCRPPETTGRERPAGTAALGPATDAYRAALAAAAAHAAAREACRIIDAEAAETRLRLRALTDRWVPRLDAALHTLTQQLEEAERAENTRLRRAATGGAP